MKNFTMKLPEILTIDESDLNTRHLEDECGKYKEIKSKNQCCVCSLNMWVQSHQCRDILIEGFKVIDPRAYTNGVIPDYLKLSNVLKEAHYSCKDELVQQLNNGTFVV